MSKFLRLNEKVVIKPSYVQSVCVCEDKDRRRDSLIVVSTWALVITLPNNNRIEIDGKDEKTCQKMFEKLWDVLNDGKSLTSDECEKGLFWEELEKEEKEIGKEKHCNENGCIQCRHDRMDLVFQERIEKEKARLEREEKEKAFLKWDRFVFGALQEIQDGGVKKMELSDYLISLP